MKTCKVFISCNTGDIQYETEEISNNVIVINDHYYPVSTAIEEMAIETMKTNRRHEVLLNDGVTEETIVLVNASRSQGMPLKRSRYWAGYTTEGWLDDSYST